MARLFSEDIQEWKVMRSPSSDNIIKDTRCPNIRDWM